MSPVSRWECGSCGLTETLRIVPDCCSACGGSVFSEDYDFAAVADAEAACLDAQESAYADEAIPLDPPAVDGLVLLGLAGVLLLVMAMAMPSGMDACQAGHSFDVCHNALFR